MVCSCWLVYSGIGAWCASEGGRGKRASVGRDGKKERTKAGERLAFEFPDASTVLEHTGSRSPVPQHLQM